MCIRLLVISLLLTFLGICTLQAQSLGGHIKDEKGEGLPGATVYWKNTTDGVVADMDGHFEIARVEGYAILVINFVGYDPAEVEVAPDLEFLDITIEGQIDLETVEVVGQASDHAFSTLDNRNIETIGHGELRKSACCSLAESFETNASVDVTYADAITGTREIQMLGLRGVYTQFLTEKRPSLNGLAAPYALEYIPGTWLESIQIAKGAGSVVSGPSAITGQINAELVKPWEDKPLFVNLFGSTMNRGEANIHLNKVLTKNWSTGLLLHGAITENQIDHDEDTFLDGPNKQLLTGLYRLFYTSPVWEFQFNVQALREQRRGGQIVPEGQQGDFFTTSQKASRIDAFGKVAFNGFQKEGQGLGFIYNYVWHDANSFFGNNVHSGTQRSFYGNLIHVVPLFRNGFHKFSSGLSLQMDQFDEYLNDTDLSRQETLPGVFAEYSFHPEIESCDNPEFKWQRFGFVAGIRYDHHNQFGNLISPRVNAKYNFNEEMVMRVSLSKGYRSANVIAENYSVLTTNRTFSFQNGPLRLEEAWNAGLNYTYNFDFLEHRATIAFDAFRTWFQNQIVVDVEEDYTKVFFFNLHGPSYSNSIVTTFSFEPVKGLEAKLAYKFTDVKMTYLDGELRTRPLVARHRGLATLGYESPNGRWMLNLITQVVGPQRLPDNSQIPQALLGNHPEYSPTYALVNAQVTHKLRSNFEIYIGGENLTNYRQDYPIIGFTDPFGEYFNGMQVYAPVMGTVGYVGLRYWVAQ
ncbi:MAG: TonB-dependent receptor [Saprospirales bacterium]|nr:TonB-dependent receptor [Saprospirales bacterium]